jgi:mRNA interferase MazF
MYKYGDIVLVNLNPQKNDEVGKVRPCVIVSDSDVNEILDLISIVPCTTNILGEGLFRVSLSLRDGLDKKSEIMIEQIRGVSKKRVLKPLSKVTQSEIQKIKAGLKALLNI